MLFEFFSKASFCVRVIYFLDSIIIAFQKIRPYGRIIPGMLQALTKASERIGIIREYHSSKQYA
jgi:hypothetical protein